MMPWWWPLNKIKECEPEMLDAAVDDIVDDDDDITQEINPNEFTDDLPKSMTSNEEVMGSIRRSDAKSKKVYDSIDQQIRCLRVARLRLVAKKGS
jgi:hypothetical protein